MTRPTILVTGATGFIGSRIVEVLAKSGSVKVLAGTHRAPTPGRFAALPVSQVHCDILNRNSLAEATSGTDIVINCARDDFDVALAAKGTRNILEAARSRGVHRVVHFSSVAVYGEATGAVSEITPPTEPLTEYGKAKLASEALCEEASGPELKVAVIRPALVYGPGGEEWTTNFIRAISSGRLQRMGLRTDGDANLVYVGDVAKLAECLSTQEIPDYSVYNANGPDHHTFTEYFDLLSKGLGAGPFRSQERSQLAGALRYQIDRMSVSLARRAGSISRHAFRSSSLELALRNLELALSQHASPQPNRFSKRRHYSIDRALSMGFRPRTSLQEGVAASLQWALEKGVLEMKLPTRSAEPPQQPYSL